MRFLLGGELLLLPFDVRQMVWWCQVKLLLEYCSWLCCHDMWSRANVLSVLSLECSLLLNGWSTLPSLARVRNFWVLFLMLLLHLIINPSAILSAVPLACLESDNSSPLAHSHLPLVYPTIIMAIASWLAFLKLMAADMSAEHVIPLPIASIFPGEQPQSLLWPKSEHTSHLLVEPHLHPCSKRIIHF